MFFMFIALLTYVKFDVTPWRKATVIIKFQRIQVVYQNITLRQHLCLLK